MSRTKLRQLEQVRGSQTYNDAYAGAHNVSVAENQSGLLSLEDDLNVLRTQIKQLKGAHLSDWYSEAGDGYTLSGLYDGYTQNSIDLEVLRGSFGTIIDSEGNFVPLLNTNYLEALTVSQYFQSLDANLKRVDDGYAAEDGYLAAYVGKTGLGSEMPTYSSNYRVTQGSSLETAIGALDDGYNALLTEVNNIEAALGIVVDAAGSASALIGTNYLTGNMTVSDDIIDLDIELKRVDDGYAAEDSAIRSFIGKGSLGAETPNYNRDGYAGNHQVGVNDDLELAIAKLDDGYHGLNEEVNTMTLQRVFNQGLLSEPDLLIPNDHKLDIHLGTNSWFEVTNSSGVNTFRVNDDGYVIVDGYLAVTGGTFQIDTVVTDADHLLLSPNIGNQPALQIKPSATTTEYTANLMELWTGSDGSQVVTVSESGNMTLETGLTLAYGNLVDGYYARSDAFGNVNWAQIQDTEVASAFNGTNYLDAYTDVHSALAQLDSQISANSGTVGATAFNDGYGTTANGSLGGFVTYDVNVVANELYVDNTTPGSSVGISDTFSKTDFVSFTMGSAGLVDISTTSNADIAMYADGYMGLSADGYVQLESASSDILFKDNRSNATSSASGHFRLSTSSAGGADFSASLRTAAGALGYLSSTSSGELGIIDAINTAFEAGGGGIVEKAVFVVSSGDGRLSNSGKTLALSSPERGSVDLIDGAEGYGLNFVPARDLEVWVNGMLLLADSAQQSSPSAAVDDYYLDADMQHLVFSFALAAGDVVVVKNSKAAAGETVSTGW